MWGKVRTRLHDACEQWTAPFSKPIVQYACDVQASFGDSRQWCIMFHHTWRLAPLRWVLYGAFNSRSANVVFLEDKLTRFVNVSPILWRGTTSDAVH